MENCKNTITNSESKVPYNPGWNDPPTFSYSQQTTPNKPRNLLNKRVAFPLSNTANSPAPQLPMNMPPIPTLIPGPPTQPIEKPQIEASPEIDAINTLEEVTRILLEFLEQSTELGTKAADIRRRISVMQDMWSSGKLNKTIHIQMSELACALRDDEPSKADEIHRALMVDHVSAVGTWMPAIKQLIHHCMARSELLAIDKE